MKTRVLLPIFALLIFSVCSPQRESSQLPAGHPTRLEEMIQSLLDIATRGDEQSLRLKLESIFPTADRVQRLLNPSRLTEGLGEVFEVEIKQSALRELPSVLVEARQLRFDQIKLSRVSPQSGTTNAPGDLALLEQLKDRSGLYTVRLLKEGKSKGLRLSGWLYIEGHGWISLLKLGEEIERRGQR